MANGVASLCQSSSNTPVGGSQNSSLPAADGRVFNCLTGGKISGFRSSRRGNRFVPYERDIPVDSKCLYTSLFRPDAVNSDKGTGISKKNKKKMVKVQKTAWNEFLSGTWRIYEVSPLHSFDSSAESLRYYSRHLSATVRGISRNFDTLEESAGLADVQLFNAQLGKADGFIVEFKMYQQTGSTAADNQLSASRANTSSAGNTKIVLKAYLFSTLNPSCSTKDSNGFTIAPLLLVRGPVRLTNVLLDWIRARFDCCITVHNFTSVDLCWLVAMFAGFVTEKSPKTVKLVYQAPEECSGLTTFTYEIKPHDCKRLWESVRIDEEDENRFTAQQALAFMMALENHFYHYFKIRLSAMKIVRIGTPCFTIDTDGRIKLHAADRVQQVLACIEQFSCLISANTAVEQQQQSNTDVE